MLVTKTKLILITALFLAAPFAVSALSEGEVRKFYVDPSYDLYNRDEIDAELLRTTNSLYFYIEKNWWEGLTPQEQNDTKIALFDLGEEFKSKIYLALTSNFGSEWKPGIDNDERITVLFHPLKRGSGGYFSNGNEYSKFQNPSSNEREMVYLNTEYIQQPLIKSFLAHEFVHLLTFNQKERIQKTEEEVWLNEARAEYAPTLLGYDKKYEGSNLQKRVKGLLDNPSDSLTEWRDAAADYGILNLFTQYLVDHYGINILIDSLRSPKKGIESINYALAKNGFKDDFSQIFTNWTIAVLINDCSLGNRYCYRNPVLNGLRIVPESTFLPTGAEITLSVYSQLKDWSAKWQKIFGGKGDLTLKFIGREGVKFKVPYILCDYDRKCVVKFFTLDERQKGEIFIPEFSSKYSSLTLISSVQNKLSGFIDSEPVYPFSWEVETRESPADDSGLIRQLLEQIDYLRAEIARLQAEIAAKIGVSPVSCQKINNELYFGIMDNQEVRCLQQFLKDQGPEIYPEGLVTGNFLFLTQQAIIRFQEKYASEILAPLGLQNGTGYVGQMTRIKINQILGF